MPKSTGAKKHTHKYHQIDGIWHCGFGDCTHFMPLNVARNIYGKLSICWSCEKDFELTPNLMKISKPVCAECAERLDRINQFLEQKGVKELTPLEIARQRMEREKEKLNEIDSNKLDDYDGNLV